MVHPAGAAAPALPAETDIGEDTRMPQQGLPSDLLGGKERLLKPFPHAAEGLVKARTEARRLHLPLTETELHPKSPVRNAENAAPLYRQIVPLVQKQEKSLPAGWDNVYKPGRTAANVAAAKEALARSAEMLKLADTSATKPQCDFGRDWNDGLTTSTPEYSPMRHLARLRAAQATLRLAAAAPLEAISFLDRGMAVSRHIGQDPGIVAYLLRLNILSVIAMPWAALLQQYGGDARVFAALNRLQSQCEGLTDPHPAFRSDSFMTRPALERFRRGDKDGVGMLFQGEPTPWLPDNLTPAERAECANAWEARILGYWDSLFSAVGQPNATLTQWDKKLGVLYAEVKTLMFGTGGGPDISYGPIVMFAAPYQGAIRQAREVEARIRLQRAALLVLDLKKRTGRFPASPPAGLPLDPFTDRPLRYKLGKDGLVLYSIGVNGTDDSGSTKKVAVEGEDSEFPVDIVLSLPI